MPAIITFWRSQQNGHVSANQPVALAHLPKGGRWPEYAFPGVGSLDTLIVERDDGMFAIGFDDDAPGPFESRQFAESVASQSGGASS